MRIQKFRGNFRLQFFYHAVPGDAFILFEVSVVFLRFHFTDCRYGEYGMTFLNREITDTVVEKVPALPEITGTRISGYL
jgi:hypothetical protein